MDEGKEQKIIDFFHTFKHQKFRKGEIFIRADEEPSGIYYLEKGFVKTYAISKKGEEVVVKLYKPVSFFPMYGLFTNSKNRFYFEATSEAEVYKVPQAKVLTFIKENPDVMMVFLANVYNRMDEVLLRTAYLMGASAYSRLAMDILLLIKDFGKKEGESVKVSVTEKDLAAYTGLTRETVSRELANLKKKKLMDFGHHFIVVKNVEKLKKELEDEM